MKSKFTLVNRFFRWLFALLRQLVRVLEGPPEVEFVEP